VDGGFENGDSVLTKAMAGLDGVLGLTEAIGEPKPGGVVLTEAVGELAVAWVSPVMVGGLDRDWEKEGGKHL